MASTLARQPTTPAAPAEPSVDRAGIPDDATVRLRAPANGTEPPVIATSPGRGATPSPNGTGSWRDTEAEQRRSASTGHLVTEVASDVSTLLRQEIALAKAEMREEATKAGKGAGMFAGAGGAAYFAVLFILLAVMFGLSSVMALGWAALIVGALLAGAAAVLALLGRHTVKTVHPTPAQTVETLREDVHWARERRH